MSFSKKEGKGEMSFLEHLEELRWHLMRSVIAIIVVFIVIFLNKAFVFDSATKKADTLNTQKYCSELGASPTICPFGTFRRLCSLG